jgi:hypothetical protein
MNETPGSRFKPSRFLLDNVEFVPKGRALDTAIKENLLIRNQGGERG